MAPGSSQLREDVAWVLHRRPYRENSFLLELLTPGEGRVGALVRGGRKGSAVSELASFAPLRIQYRSAAELVNLRGHELSGRHLALEGLALWSGFYLNELLLRVLPRGQGAGVFPAYGDCLRALAAAVPPEQCLRQFEYRLLTDLGLALDPAADARGQSIRIDEQYRWTEQAGLEPASKGVSGHALLALIHARDAELWPQTRPLLAQMLAPLLGPQPLNSARMLRELRALRAAGVRPASG